MRTKNKGFTLIELLAVIVILGLLMAIAIPSVTRYITESRKKTLTTTMGNYIGALVNEVNDLSYTFTGNNTIYAVPIECIALERGGTNPFGEWYQANDNYWAYVLIQYDDENSKYVYGFTFKDSAGYGLYPTIQAKIKETGSQIKTGLDLNRPKTGDVTSLTTLTRWQESGFEVDATTNFQVLEAESEGVIGDGEMTCTLTQKGNNYASVEEEKTTKPQLLTKLIRKHNPLINYSPNLTTSSNNSNDVSGLYSSSATNSGKITYYFRGDVPNNYVSFANQTWRIIRINEDGTIRIISESRVNNSALTFNSGYSMYYSNGSKAKTQLETWYNNNITKKGYDGYISTSMFCEQAKVKASSNYFGNGNTMDIYTSYTPSFRCASDGKGFGILNSKVGLITVDEVMHAGGYPGKDNSDYYLTNGVFGLWTMSPAGYDQSGFALEWVAYATGSLDGFYVSYQLGLRPVISLKTNTMALGTGTETDPYVIQTN